MTQRGIAQAVIARLPRYYRYLGDLKERGVTRISSQELSAIMKVTASQIRQDFNHFGGFGQQGYGYRVDYLYEEIGKILGIDQNHRMVLIGAGNLGQALIHYGGFSKRGFTFVHAFDVDEKLHNQSIDGVVVHPMEALEETIRSEGIEIAVLTLPGEAAVAVAERLVQAGIRAVWNFAHVDLEVPEGVVVENVHLSDSLMKLSYNITTYEQTGKRTKVH